MKYKIILIALILSIGIISALDISNPTITGVNIIPEEAQINYSTINVNNSQYLRGYSPTTLRTWMNQFFDGVYVNEDGDTMTGDLDMDNNDILNVNNVHSDYYFGDGTYLNTSLLDGSIVFSDGSNFAEDNEYFKWDDTNKRLGVKIPSTESADDTLSVGGNLDFVSIPIPTDAEIGGIGLSENTGAGTTMQAGEYYYNVQWIDAYGNTCGYDYSHSPSITISGGSSVTLTNIPIPTDSRVVGRRIMRTNVGGSAYQAYKIYDINDVTTTTFTDTGYSPDTNYRIYRSPDFTAGLLTLNGVNMMVVQPYNTFLGRYAGNSITSGANNVLLGASAGISITTGANNVFAGQQIGIGITTGNSNIAMGYTALYNVYETSNNNVNIGYLSGRSQASSVTIGNVGLGSYALYPPAYESLYNTAIGYGAGRDIAQSGNAHYNTLIGYQAGYGTLDNGDYNIIIGANADVSTANAQYELNIGDLITGSMTGSTYAEIVGDLKLGDNYKHYFGSADDISLAFDGSNFNLVGEIGSPNFTIDLNGGNIKIFGDLNMTNNSIEDIHQLKFANGDYITGNNSMSFNVDGIQKLILRGQNSTFSGEVINIDDLDGISRFSETNINNGTNSVAAFTAINNIGNQIWIAITGNNFTSTNPYTNANQGGIFLKSNASMGFTISNYQGFHWKNNKIDDSEFDNASNMLMTLSRDGDLNISGSLTTNSDKLKVRKSDNQTIINGGVWNNITWDLEDFDTGNLHNTTTNNITITLNHDGYYFLSYHVKMESNNKMSYSSRVLLNGEVLYTLCDMGIGSKDSSYITLTNSGNPFYLNAGDELILQLSHDDGGGINLMGEGCYFSVTEAI